jgi:hypothetical protein
VTRDLGGEADHSLWVRPVDAGDLLMLPPTAYHLKELARYPDIDAVLAGAAERDLTTPVLPQVVTDAAGAWFVLP